MLLNDIEIRKLCVGHSVPVAGPMIEPFSEAVSGNGVISWGLTHAGYDVRLGSDIWISKPSYGEVVDPKRMKEEGYEDKIYDKIKVEGDSFILPPHSHVLARTVEYLRIPKHMKARCTGKSTMARCGIVINTTPLEPNWRGFLVIEIGNISPCPVRLYVNQGISQIEFELLTAPPETDYDTKGGKYQNQTGVTPARVQ